MTLAAQRHSAMRLPTEAACLLDTPRYQIVPFTRVDKVLGRKHIGSVIVDHANGDSFQPAPGRIFFAGVEAPLRRC